LPHLAVQELLFRVFWSSADERELREFARAMRASSSKRLLGT